MAEVELRNVVKRFGATLVVHGVDLRIRDSEFVVLVGPSGCGKSTVLRMIAGLEKVSGGEILINGQLVNHVSPKDRNVAMVFQNYALYPHMSVRDNMGFGLKMAKRSRREIAAAVDKAAAVLELEPLLDRKPAELSGGQRQRVAMGRAIVRQPAVFLFDEPLSNLDAQLRMQMRIELRKMHLRLKTTTIYVTHDQIESMTLADRIVILNDGCIQQVGTPVEVFEQPANVFVAQFIGNPPMNILSGGLEPRDGALCFVRGGMALPLPQNKWADITSGQQVLLGVRPDAVKVAHALERIPERWRTRGRVVISEVLGAHSLLALQLEGANIITEVEGRLGVGADEEIEVGFDLERASLFDPESTKGIA